MSVPTSPYHHLRCEQVGAVTVAIASREAFAESTHPDDWTPHLSDISTNREIQSDLALLAKMSPGAVVLDLGEVDGLLGDASCYLLEFARVMAEGKKPVAICSGAPLYFFLQFCGVGGRLPCTLERASALALVQSGPPCG